MKPSSVSGDRHHREAADSDHVEDWLPEGWTVEFRARRNGRQDKYYLSPSNQRKFYSKSEVTRYLNSLQTSNPNTEENKNVNDKRSAENVVIEKGTPEGLPPGWIKEIKVTKKGGRMRKDPYYIDPATGYIFHSMKDALRYVETGDVGRLASKPKDKGNDDVELEDDNVSSATAAKKQKIVGTGDCNKELSLKFEVTERDEQSLKSSTCTEEYPPLSGHTSDEGAVDAELSCAGVLKRKDPEEIEKQTDVPQIESVSSPAVPEKEPLENGAMGFDNSSKKRPCRKPKDKRTPSVPRRTSKRLAGVEVNLALEIKPNARALKAAGKESCEPEANEQKIRTTATTSAHQPSNKIDQPKQGLETDSTSVASTSNEMLLYSNNVNHPSVELGTEREGVERKRCSSILPPEIHFREVEEANRGDEKLQSSLDLPFDILNDPCIEFAIKTLTGATFDASEAIDGLSESNSSKKYSKDAATTTGEHAPIQYSTDVRQTSLSIPEQSGNKEVQKPAGSSLDFPCGDLWTDPCIEFAVKTLTGAIPLEYDMNIQDLRQRLVPPQAQGNNELTLSNVDIYQADFWCPQYPTVDKSVFKQQTVVEPSLTGQSGSVNFRSSGAGTSMRPHNAAGARSK